MKFLESNWQKPDEGIWEVRGGRKNFTHSKMMAWVAFDCAVKLVEECGCAAGEHHDRWRKVGSKFAQKFASAVTTQRERRSRSFTVPMRWMPAC